MNAEKRHEASDDARLTKVLISKAMRKEIKEIFKSLKDVFSQPDFLSRVITTTEFKELLAKAKSVACEFGSADPLCCTVLRVDIENAFTVIDALCFAVKGKESDDTLRDFYDKALRRLTSVNDGLKGW